MNENIINILCLFIKSLFTIHNSRTMQLEVQNTIQQTENAVEIVFNQPQNAPLSYKSGQFLTLIIKVGKEEFRRSYSICSSYATQQSTISVLVKRVEGGKISNLLNNSIKKGDLIDVLAPTGTFAPEILPNNQYFLFAGGSGITPMMSILQSVLHTQPTSEVCLIYASRNEENILFRERLENLQNEFGNKLKIFHVLSRPSTTWTDNGGFTGRLIADVVEKIMKENTSENRAENPLTLSKQYLMCGTSGMMETITHTFEKLGLQGLKKESFAVDFTQKTVPVEFSKERITQNITVIYNGNTYNFDVNPSQTILEAAMKKNIDLPYSCQSGLCTACLGKCTQGAIKNMETDALTDKEIAEGYVLTCSAHPISTGVVIEID